jgi:hypothetical protein
MFSSEIRAEQVTNHSSHFIYGVLRTSGGFLVAPPLLRREKANQWNSPEQSLIVQIGTSNYSVLRTCTEKARDGWVLAKTHRNPKKNFIEINTYKVTTSVPKPKTTLPTDQTKWATEQKQPKRVRVRRIRRKDRRRS